jgi:C-terminal processing protease CtpA/Prc
MGKNRIAAAQRGIDYADCYAAAHRLREAVSARRAGRTGKDGRAAALARGAAARDELAADVLRGPLLAPGSLTPAERMRAIDGLERVIEGAYTHLPLKRARYAIDPVQRLRLLRARVLADTSLDEQTFHHELADILTRLRDAHTRYSGPAALEDVSAVLPFFVEMIGSTQDPTYVVSRVTENLGSTFKAGVVVKYWNGVPIDLAVLRWSEHEVGGRPDSQRAAAVLSLTMRSLQYGTPPDEHWVIVGYQTVDAAGRAAGTLMEVRVPWRIVIPARAAQPGGRASARLTPARRTQALRVSVNPAAAAVRQAKMLMFAPQVLASAPRATSAPARRAADPTESLLPATLRVKLLATPGGPVAMLRIWAFDQEPGPYLAELQRLLPLLPQRGLIIDVRGNPGGFIEAAERSLQFFTPRRIVPTRFSVLATPMTRALSRIKGWPTDEMAPWRDSLDAAVRNGEQYSQPLPLTAQEACNDIGQIYGGPVVLVADAATYSSGDLFSAGFVDNAIGPFVCVGEATGAGGANVWNYTDLRNAFAGTEHALPLLPDGIGLSLSMRRATRSGPSEGLQIEDVGVAPPDAANRYAMTRDDLLNDNRDLVAHCLKLLRAQPLTGLSVELRTRPRRAAITTQGLDRVDPMIDGVPQATLAAADGRVLELALPATARRLDLAGVKAGNVVQRRRIDLRD